MPFRASRIRRSKRGLKLRAFRNIVPVYKYGASSGARRLPGKRQLETGWAGSDEPAAVQQRLVRSPSGYLGHGDKGVVENRFHAFGVTQVRVKLNNQCPDSPQRLGVAAEKGFLRALDVDLRQVDILSRRGAAIYEGRQRNALDQQRAAIIHPRTHRGGFEIANPEDFTIALPCRRLFNSQIPSRRRPTVRVRPKYPARLGIGFDT